MLVAHGGGGGAGELLHVLVLLVELLAAVLAALLAEDLLLGASRHGGEEGGVDLVCEHGQGALLGELLRSYVSLSEYAEQWRDERGEGVGASGVSHAHACRR